MTIQPGVGELFVGAYLRMVEECEIVTYNQRSDELGNQMELDVLGIKSEGGTQTIIACEVVTHLNGLLRNGTPATDCWTEYGNKDYQYTLERTWKKFHSDYQYVTDVFDDADTYRFQLWSPNVPVGHRTRGLEELRRRFRTEFGSTLILAINQQYRARIERLRDRAADDTKDYGDLGFRVFQILENLR